MTSRKDWKTSITVHIPQFSAARMADLSENDIHYVELTGATVDQFNNFSEMSKPIFKTAADYDVKIRSVHLPFMPFDEIDPASLDAKTRKSFLDVCSEIVRISADQGAEIAVVHPSGEPYAENTRGENLKCAIDSMAKLNELARREGMTLAVENLPRTCIARDCMEIKEIGLQIPDIHFVFDSNHSLKDSNPDIIKAMGNRIVALHISDYEFIDELHEFPGEGKISWQEIMKCLEEVDYSGTWNYEIKNCNEYSARVFKDNHMRLLSGEIK